MSFFGDLAEFLAKKGSDEKIEPISSETTSSLALKRLAMYTAVSYISAAMSMCEVKTYEKGRPVKGELYHALNLSPNPNQSAQALMAKLVEKYYYDGAALMVQPLSGRNWFYVADSFGVVSHPLYEDEFTSVSVESRTLSRPIRAGDACYFRLSDRNICSLVSSMYDDLGAILAAAMDSFKLASGEKFTFTRGGSPGGNREDSAKQVREVNDALKGFIRSPNAVLPMYREQKLERVSANPTASAGDVVSLRKDIFETTASAFKIPQSMMYGNMTNTDQVLNQFITFSIDPLANMISAEMTRKFFPYDEWNGGERRIQINTATICHADMFQVADKVDKLISSGCASIDDARAGLGLDPLGEEFSQAHWVTKNYSPIEEALAQQGNEPAKGGEQ